MSTILQMDYDLAVAWVWRYDAEFVRCLVETAKRNGLKILSIEAHTIAEVLERVRTQTIRFSVLLDRASDEDENFIPLVRLIQDRHRDRNETSRVTTIVNPPDLVHKASDKATMHLEFLSHNINVPYSIIISPYNHKKEIELTLSELAKLGRPFIVKPANTTGGGIGVVTGAETLKDVLEARQHHRNDKYLLQETIRPVSLRDRRAWFRVFYVFGGIYPCWWDDQTHIYEVLTDQDEEAFGLRQLRTITTEIHDVCQLDFFSTELVLTGDRRIVAVDYVNEMCDMRPKSVHLDGVPDEIVSHIAEEISNYVRNGRTTKDFRNE